MKVNIFTLIVALIVGGLLLYGFYSMTGNYCLPILGAVFCTLFLIVTMSISLPGYPRSSATFKTLSGILFFLLLIANLVFFQITVPISVFVITNGLIAAIGATGLHHIYKSKQ